MKEEPIGFADWACDPARTVEERYGARLLIEQTAHTVYWKKFQIRLEVEFYRGSINRRERFLDPAYDPTYEPEWTRWTEEVLPEIKSLRFGFHDDRPLRDVSFLRFCNGLEELDFSSSEVVDWSPLAGLAGLKKFGMLDRKASDLRCFSELRGLEQLRLVLFQPWPDLRGLEQLSQLRDFQFKGNLLALRDIPTLEGLHRADFDCYCFKLPLQKVSNLPAMPLLLRMELKDVCDLDGIQSYPRLLNLEIHGGYTDLTPLAGLQHLTHLLLGCTETPEVTALNHLTSLRRVTFDMEFPPDLTPLAEAVRLHEIKLSGTPIIPAELDALNTLFESWDDEFGSPQPRSPGPLKMRFQADVESRWNESPAAPRDWGDDQEMAKSEDLWFTRKVNRRLDRLLGKGWGHLNEKFPRSPGGVHILITRAEDIDRLPAIAHAMRKLMAAAKHPWRCTFSIDSLARFERGMDEIEKDEDEFDAEGWLRETREWHEKDRDRRNYLRRKYLHRLSLETGIPVPPAEPPDAGGKGQDAGNEEEEESFSPFAESPEYNLGTKLQLYATLNETHIYVWESERELAEMLFELKAEE